MVTFEYFLFQFNKERLEFISNDSVHTKLVTCRPY